VSERLTGSLEGVPTESKVSLTVRTQWQQKRKKGKKEKRKKGKEGFLVIAFCSII
jgi:hypothetical protein